MTHLDDIAQTIRTHRKQRRLTQHQLAERAHVSRALVAELERGRLPEIGVKKLLRLLNAVGLELRVTTLNMSRPTLEDLTSEEGQSQ